MDPARQNRSEKSGHQHRMQNLFLKLMLPNNQTGEAILFIDFCSQRNYLLKRFFDTCLTNTIPINTLFPYIYDYNTHAMQHYLHKKNYHDPTFQMAQGTSWQCKQQATYQKTMIILYLQNVISKHIISKILANNF